MKMPIYECSNCYNEFSDQLYPYYICKVEYIDFKMGRYKDGCIQISCKSIDGYYTTGLLKCYTNKKGRYAIWGKHRFYEGYSGGLILRGVPYKSIETIRNAAKPYGTIVN